MKSFTKLISITYQFIAITASNMVLTFACLRLFLMGRKIQNLPATLLKVSLFQDYFLNLLYCTSGTKFGNASHITNPNIIDPIFYRIKKYKNHPSILRVRKKMVEEKLSFSFKFIDRN